MTSSRLFFAALTLAVAASLSGCVGLQPPLSSSPAEKPVEATASADVRGDLPTSTPEGLPLWPGATVRAGESTTDGAFTLLLSADEPVEEIVYGLNRGFIDTGWTVKGSLEDSSGVALEVASEDLEGLVTVYQSGSGNAIEYLLTPIVR